MRWVHRPHGVSLFHLRSCLKVMVAGRYSGSWPSALSRAIDLRSVDEPLHSTGRNTPGCNACSCFPRRTIVDSVIGD